MDKIYHRATFLISLGLGLQFSLAAPNRRVNLETDGASEKLRAVYDELRFSGSEIPRSTAVFQSFKTPQCERHFAIGMRSGRQGVIEYEIPRDAPQNDSVSWHPISEFKGHGFGTSAATAIGDFHMFAVPAEWRTPEAKHPLTKVTVGASLLNSDLVSPGLQKIFDQLRGDEPALQLFVLSDPIREQYIVPGKYNGEEGIVIYSIVSFGNLTETSAVLPVTSLINSRGGPGNGMSTSWGVFYFGTRSFLQSGPKSIPLYPITIVTPEEYIRVLEARHGAENDLTLP